MNAGTSLDYTVRRRQSVALSPPPTLRGGLPKALRERRRAVSAAEARRAFLTETAEGRAWALGQAETVWRIEDELAYVYRLRSVTAEQLRPTIVVVKPRS
jgi:hypothetical protein